MNPNSDWLTPSALAARIDHTLLKPEATTEAIIRLCEEAIQYQFATVCIHGCFVAKAAELLANHPVGVCTVAGFPLGCCHTRIKAIEAAQAIDDGADEIDMVINLPSALAGDMTYLARDVEAVLKVCHQGEKPTILKVILETAVLPVDTKITLCRLMSNLGVDFIKTSTGLHPAGGATLDDVKLLYQHRGTCKVKAAGGIRDFITCQSMILAGAERIGTSAGIAIVQHLKNP